jgi:hypothetical protein
MFEYLKKYSALIVIAILLGAVVYAYVKYRGYQSELANLRNQVAEKDRTVEVLKGQYTKLAGENTDLKASDAELRKLLKKTNQDLVAETEAKVYWKGRYVWVIENKPKPDGDFKPPPVQLACTDKPQTYTGVQDIGLLKLTIDTFTVDPSFQNKLIVEAGSKPLVLTLDLTRDANKQWRTFVKSSDERIGVEIGINSVNIEPLQPRWYERLKVHVDVGAGLSDGGVLGGLGVGYQFGAFDLGPSIWGTTAGGTYGGMNLSWAPFKN